MKKIYLLFIAATLAACSAEPIQDEVTSLDAAVTGKGKVAAEVADYLSYPETSCSGEEALFTYNFEGKENGKTNLKIDLWGDDPETAEEVVDWYPIDQQKAEGGGPAYFNYVFDNAGSYNLRYQIGGQPVYFTVLVLDCGCDESFTYVDNEDGTYTFTYVSEVDLDDAHLTFTFPQDVVNEFPESFTQNGNGNDTTFSAVVDLVACQTYSWTFRLSSDCRGNGQTEANLWTDFKVGEESKREQFGLEKIRKPCN